MPVKNVTVSEGKTILDFGQNFAGIVEIHPEFFEGETLTIRHGEILNPDDSLYTANLRKAKATVIYHAGAEKKTYRPRFTYMGFRYVELSGAEYKPGMVKAYALYTDMRRLFSVYLRLVLTEKPSAVPTLSQIKDQLIFLTALTSSIQKFRHIMLLIKNPARIVSEIYEKVCIISSDYHEYSLSPRKDESKCRI